MATHSRTPDPEVEEDFDCPVCQDVLRMPVRTKNCQHVFCRSCLETAVRTRGPRCPLCRGPVEETWRRAADVQQRMRTRKGTCRACGAEKFFSKMQLHYKTCRKYIEEYGANATPPTNIPVQTPVQIPILSPVQTPVQIPILSPVLRPVWTPVLLLCSGCPYTTVPVCPICARMPWGNTGYYSPNLIGHMLRRHCFSYARYMVREWVQWRVGIRE
uniref:E3 ubiquitin-protein ligase RNF138 n=1 Tax=Electrophorus electricus TaxID=8005 RepID=A0A4W4HS69_ELEEL